MGRAVAVNHPRSGFIGGKVTNGRSTLGSDRGATNARSALGSDRGAKQVISVEPVFFFQRYQVALLLCACNEPEMCALFCSWDSRRLNGGLSLVFCWRRFPCDMPTQCHFRPSYELQYQGAVPKDALGLIFDGSNLPTFV